MNPLPQLLEAALFAADRPIAPEELAALAPDATLAEVRAALDELREHYDFDGHGVEVAEMGGGFQLVTRPALAAAIERAQFAARTSRLSPAMLETLAVIAYRQPVGRAEIEEIRGVQASGVLRTLQERGLIEVVGRSEALGRPLLYGTAALFLELLGLPDLQNLPRVEELLIALRPHEAVAEADEAEAGEAAAYVESES